MKPTRDLLKHEPRARWYFAALAQSSLGTGAAHVALLLLAYDRYRSPWAISLVLLAELLPAMLFGPLLGAVADRWSRRGCMVVADGLRGAAFVGIVLVDSFAPTVAFAVVAGIGTGLFTPAALSSLPSLVAPERLPAATSLYGAVADLGFIGGPAISAAAFAVVGPETILAVNAATFVVSGAVLLTVRFGRAPMPSAGAKARGLRSLIREAREGVTALAGMSDIRVVVLGSGAILLAGGAFNVAELPFATESLDSGAVGFAVLATLYGTGFICGSLAGSRGGSRQDLTRWFLIGLALTGGGLITSGLAPTLWVALPAFALAGIGNGLVLVYERLLIQTTVEDSLMARIFGVRDALTAWAFAIAYLLGGALVVALGPRGVMVAAGCAGLVVWAITAVALRRTPPGARSLRGQALGDRLTGEHGPDVVDRTDDGGAAALDDRRESVDDLRVELRSGIFD